MRKGSSKTSAATDLFRSASSKASSKEMERIDNLFYSYGNRSSSTIDPEGIEALCSDMEIEHTDVRILMLACRNFKDYELCGMYCALLIVKVSPLKLSLAGLVVPNVGKSVQ